MSRGAFEEAQAKLILEFGDATAHGRGRHLYSPSRFRKAVGFDNFREENQRIQIGHGSLVRALSQIRERDFRLSHYC